MRPTPNGVVRNLKTYSIWSRFSLLATTLLGAGFYQAFRQEGGSKFELLFSTPFASNDMARLRTQWGFEWGDNPGGSLNIMKGWDYYDSNY